MEDGKAANDESKTKTLEIGSTGEVLPAVNADLVGTQQHLSGRGSRFNRTNISKTER